MKESFKSFELLVICVSGCNVSYSNIQVTEQCNFNLFK